MSFGEDVALTPESSELIINEVGFGLALRCVKWLAATMLGMSILAQASATHFSDFLIFDDNAPGVLEISLTHPEAFLTLAEVDLNNTFDFLFLKFRRDDARSWVTNLYRAAACPTVRKEATYSKVCDYLKRLWVGPLRETFFWDGSLVQLSRARELVAGPHKTPRIKREQCTEALGVVAEVEAKEGLMEPLVETQLKVFECLGDEAGRVDVYQKLETLRNIQSALGT